MENFEEKLQARVKAIEAKIALGMEKAKLLTDKAEQTYQKVKDFAVELHQEKMNALKPETESV